MPASVRRRRALLGALALVVVVVVAVLVLRGGSESAADTVSRAFGKGEAVKTATVDLKLGLSGSAAAGGQPLNLTASGPYSAGTKGNASFDFAIGLGDLAPGGAQGLGLLAAGGKTYVELGNSPFEVSTATVDKATGSSGKSAGLSFSSLGIDPRGWLQDPKRIGDEKLNGEQVTHVRSGVDTTKLGADLGKLLGKAEGVASTTDAKKQATQAVSTIQRLRKDIKTAQIDVWAAKGKGALRRMKIAITLTKGKIALDLALSKVNQKVTITAPKSAPPLDTLLKAIQAQSSASGTSTGKTGAAAGGSTSSGSDASGTD